MGAAQQAGWTPGGYGIWVLVLMAFGYVARQYVPWFKASTEREANANNVMSALVDKLQKRIDDLEEAMSRDRMASEKALSDERKRCDEETRSLHDKIEALQKIIIQWQVSTGNMLEIGSAQAPKATEAMHRMVAKMGNPE